MYTENHETSSVFDEYDRNSSVVPSFLYLHFFFRVIPQYLFIIHIWEVNASHENKVIYFKGNPHLINYLRLLGLSVWCGMCVCVCVCVCVYVQELHSTLPLMLNKETNNWWLPRLRRTVIQIWPLFTAVLIGGSEPPLIPHTYTSWRFRVFSTLSAIVSSPLHGSERHTRTHACSLTQSCGLSRKFWLK